MTDIGLCEERRDAAFGQEAGFKSGTRPTGKQAYLNKGRLVMSGSEAEPDLRPTIADLLGDLTVSCLARSGPTPLCFGDCQDRRELREKSDRFVLDYACDVRLNCAT